MRFVNCIDCPYPFVVDSAKGTIEEINEINKNSPYKVPVRIVDDSISVGHIVYPRQYITPITFQLWINYLMKDQQTLVIPYKVGRNGINYAEFYPQYISDLDLVRHGYPGRNIIISRYSDTLVYFGREDYNNNPEDHILIIPHGFKDIYRGIQQIYDYRNPDYIYTIIERLFKGERETTKNWVRAQQCVEDCIKRIESFLGFNKIYGGEFVIFGWMRKFMDSKFLYSFRSHTPYIPPNVGYASVVQQRAEGIPLDIMHNDILIERYIKSIEYTKGALEKLHLMYRDATLDEGLKIQIIESIMDMLIMIRSHMQNYLDIEKEFVRNTDYNV